MVGYATTFAVEPGLKGTMAERIATLAREDHMTTEKAPEEPKVEQDAESNGFRNAIGAAVLGRIDALIGGLQGLRNRVATAVGAATGQDGNEAATPEKRPPTAVRISFIFFLALVLGGLLGFYLSYGRFAASLDEQAEKISRQRSDLIVLERESERLQKAEAEYQEALAATQKKLVEAQRSLRLAAPAASSEPSGEGGQPATARVSSTRRSAKVVKPAAEPTGAIKPSGTCDINASDPAQSLTRCLEEFNR